MWRRSQARLYSREIHISRHRRDQDSPKSVGRLVYFISQGYHLKTLVCILPVWVTAWLTHIKAFLKASPETLFLVIRLPADRAVPAVRPVLPITFTALDGCRLAVALRVISGAGEA